MRTTNILIFCRTFSLHFSQMDSPSKFSHLSTDLCLGFFGSGLCLQSVSWKRRSEFRGPGVSRLQALAIGQVVFRALNVVESIFLLMVLAGLPDASPRVRAAALFLAGLFVVQQLALRSPLDRHIAKLITEGASASPRVANLHRAYVLLEVIKALSLILLIMFQLLDFPRQ